MACLGYPAATATVTVFCPIMNIAYDHKEVIFVSESLEESETSKGCGVHPKQDVNQQTSVRYGLYPQKG
jgi:hypothetical protein